MGRLTVNKRTADMNMVELAHNCCYARDRRATYRDYDGDYDARELTRLMFKVYTEINLPLSDEEFDWHMSEALGEPLDTKIGMLALFYRNLWAMAELHDRLKHYEDLEESGRLVVLPNDITGEQLCKIVNACPSILGLKNHCGSHSCESCWEAALKGGGDSDV